MGGIYIDFVRGCVEVDGNNKDGPFFEKDKLGLDVTYTFRRDVAQFEMDVDILEIDSFDELRYKFFQSNKSVMVVYCKIVVL